MLKSAIPSLLMGTIHFLFLYQVVLPICGGYTIVGVVPLFAYLQVPLKWNSAKTVWVANVLAFYFGLIFTIWLRTAIAISSVTAAGMIGFAGTLLPFQRIFGDSKYDLPKLFPLAVYAGTFAGMSDLSVFDGLLGVIIVGAIGGMVFNVLAKSFSGVGGKLGSIGFGAVIIFSIFNQQEQVQFRVLPFELDAFLIFIVVATAAALFTFYAAHQFKWGIVKASSLLGLIVSLPFDLFPPSSFTLAAVPVVFFGGTFVGMSSKSMQNWITLCIAGCIFGVGFYFLHPYFQGFGGTLGTLACLSCLVGLLLFKRTTA